MLPPNNNDISSQRIRCGGDQNRIVSNHTDNTQGKLVFLVAACVLTVLLSACGDRSDDAGTTGSSNPGTNPPITPPSTPIYGTSYSTSPSSANLQLPNSGINNYYHYDSGTVDGSPYTNSLPFSYEYNTDLLNVNGQGVPVITINDGTSTSYLSAANGWWWSLGYYGLDGWAITPYLPTTILASKVYQIPDSDTDIYAGVESTWSSTLTYTVESMSATSPTDIPISSPAAISYDDCIRINYTFTYSLIDIEIATGNLSTQGTVIQTGTEYYKSGVGLVYTSYNYNLIQHFYIDGILDYTQNIDTDTTTWLTSSTASATAPVYSN